MDAPHGSAAAVNRAPLVSVIIPTHNRAGLVSRSIRSVLDQTYQAVEVIVVDDGSSDDTGTVVRGISDPRVRYLRHEQPRGACAARNSGIDAARGEWMAFLDDDDRFLPRKIERQLAVAADCVAVVTAFQRLGGSHPRVLGMQTIELAHLRRGNRFSGSGILARAEVARSVRFDESLPRGQDWDFLIRLVASGTVRYLPEILFEVDNGPHVRITNWMKGRSFDEIERSAIPLVKKLKPFLGGYWTRYLMAGYLTAYIGSQGAPAARLLKVAQAYGLVPTAHVLVDKAIGRHR